MVYWIEVHCDVPMDTSMKFPQRGPYKLIHACFSMSGDSHAGWCKSVAGANREAKKSGWKIVDGKWICPGCQPHMKTGSKND